MGRLGFRRARSCRRCGAARAPAASSRSRRISRPTWPKPSARQCGHARAQIDGFAQATAGLRRRAQHREFRRPHCLARGAGGLGAARHHAVRHLALRGCDRRRSRAQARHDVRDAGHRAQGRRRRRSRRLWRHLDRDAAVAHRNRRGGLRRRLPAQRRERHAGRTSTACRPTSPAASSMDMLAIDVRDVPQVAVGDRVELWGRAVPIERVAAAAGTIGYELTCRVSRRVASRRATLEGPRHRLVRPDRRRHRGAAHAAPPGHGPRPASRTAHDRTRRHPRHGADRVAAPGTDAVVHTASLHVPDLAARSREDFRAVNVDATRRLLEAAGDAGVAPLRLHQHDLALRRRDAAVGRCRGLGRRVAHAAAARHL